MKNKIWIDIKKKKMDELMGKNVDRYKKKRNDELMKNKYG